MLRLLLVVALAASAALASPTGAPQTACSTMAPNHGSSQPSTDPPITAISASLNEDFTWRIDLAVEAEGDAFRGFFIQVREAGSTEPQGTFTVTDTSTTQLRPCPNDASAANGVTHTDRTDKTGVSVQWNPSQTGDFIVTATTVQSYASGTSIHWVGQEETITVTQLPTTY